LAWQKLPFKGQFFTRSYLQILAKSACFLLSHLLLYGHLNIQRPN
jgi:hypothetical protein